MRCFFCGSDQSSVIDKRAVKRTDQIRRRRECLRCHKRYTTYEQQIKFELYVIKRNGQRQIFDRDKLKIGIAKALEKRPQLAAVDTIVDKIEQQVKGKREREVPSKVIGQAVLAELKKIDHVAYLRFASVYRHFSKPADFKKELDNLKFR